MDLQLGTMLYKSETSLFSSRIGMIKSKKRLPKTGYKSDPQWIYEVEWYYGTGGISSAVYYSNSQKLAEYRYAYIALQRSITDERL